MRSPTGGAHLSAPPSTSSRLPPWPRPATAPRRLPGFPAPPHRPTSCASMRRHRHLAPSSPATAAAPSPAGINGGRPSTPRRRLHAPSPAPLRVIKGAASPPLHPAPLLLPSSHVQRHRRRSTAHPPELRPDLSPRRSFLRFKFPDEFPFFTTSR
jgi:hypothetical protein